MAIRFKNDAPAKLDPSWQDPNGPLPRVSPVSAYFPSENAYQSMRDDTANTVRENWAKEEIQGEISKLEAELAKVEAQIAEIDKTMPKDTDVREWDIAAERAGIGDMSAYDSMVQRAHSQNGQASGIENELYNAHKLLYGLNAKDDYEQGAFANQIETALRRADEWSARNPGASMPPIYADLKSKYEAWKEGNTQGPPAGKQEPAIVSWVDGIRNENDATNKIDAMVKDGTWKNADLEAGYAWVKANPNSPYTKTIKDKLDSVKDQTVEARADSAAKAKKMEKQVRYIIDRPVSEQNKWWDSLSKKQRDSYVRFGLGWKNDHLVWRKK